MLPVWVQCITKGLVQHFLKCSSCTSWIRNIWFLMERQIPESIPDLLSQNLWGWILEISSQCPFLSTYLLVPVPQPPLVSDSCQACLQQKLCTAFPLPGSLISQLAHEWFLLLVQVSYQLAPPQSRVHYRKSAPTLTRLYFSLLYFMLVKIFNNARYYLFLYCWHLVSVSFC